jgi:hypothetical protein
VPGRPARVGRHEQERGNGVNPRVGGPLQHAAPRQGGGSRRGGTRPRGRNTDGKWHSHPEGGRPPGNRRAISGSGLPGEQHDGGAIFGQSQERKLGRAAARLNGRAAGPGSVGKDGAKVRRGKRTSFTGCEPPRRWSSKAATPRDRARSKATEDSSEGPRAATSFRASPRSRRVSRRKPGEAPRGQPPGRARDTGGWEATCRKRREYPCRPPNPTPGPDVDQRGAIPLNGVRALVRPPPSTRERRARSSL